MKYFLFVYLISILINASCSYKKTTGQIKEIDNSVSEITFEETIPEDRLSLLNEQDLNEVFLSVIERSNNSKNPVMQNIIGAGINEEENVVEVYLMRDFPAFIKAFKEEISNSPHIRFEATGKAERIINGGGEIICDHCNITASVKPEKYLLKTLSIPLTITNGRDTYLHIGKSYVEFFNGNGWDRINLDIISEAQASLFIAPYSNCEIEIPLYSYVYDYMPGKYRILQILYNGGQELKPTHESWTVAAEFWMDNVSDI